MKLSVSAFRAQASAQRKILSSYQSQLNYGTCTSFPALGRYNLDGNTQMMVDNTGLSSTLKSAERTQYAEGLLAVQQMAKEVKEERAENEATPPSPGHQEETHQTTALEKSPGRNRSKSNQRWMKLRTTVQLSGAISSTSQKTKPPLKREDSFLKRFSTRQIPEAQETIDTGDETETLNGSQTQNEVNRRRRKRRKEMSKTVVNPDENFYFYWLMTVTICVLYNLWTLIVRQSFPELQRLASAFWFSGDGFADVVFACDIVVQFRTGYLEQGLMVYNSKKLATHYLKSRAFVLDILSLLPLDFLQLNFGVNPILRFPRFLKIYRVYDYYYMVESRTVYPNLWRVVNLIHILLILAHWFGCFYYLLSEAEGFQGDWVYPYRSGDYATLTRKYLGSLYWSTLTLTTIGDLPTPETNAEYLFTIISYLIGVFIFATIVGQVGNVITNRNANRLEFERLLDGAKTYMRHHKVPGGMKRRVLRWYDYSWSRGRIQGGGDINTALGLLPDKLKTELALHVNLSVLKKVTIFQECQPEFLHDLVLKMKAYIFTPGDLICRKGEVAREMFIIADGILDVISETGRVLTTMKAGDFFGEIGILNLDGLNKRTADVRSVGYSELFSLSREDVLTAMKDYPEAQEILQTLGRKRLMEAKNASKTFKAQVKQSKDHDSSGESDTAGKRIVERLRSDVKGLKDALGRSRRGTRTKEALERAPEGSGGKYRSKKHSTLRRMSHVQSSDEYEANNDEHSPVGVGLPLLQRLKLLKEKQEREREEKEKSKLNFSCGSRNKAEESSGAETTGLAMPFTQKLKLLKQKEIKNSAAHGSSTVRTQVTGVRFDRSTHEGKNVCYPGEPEQKAFASKNHEKNNETNHRNKDSTDSGKISPRERLTMVQGSLAKDNLLPSRTSEDSDGPGANPGLGSGTSTNLPPAKEATKSVPKSVENKSAVPKSKDAWKLLKKSSISPSKSNSKSETEKHKLISAVSKRGAYLSKSDTVLERQRTLEAEGKRSRSESPSGSRKISLRQAVENLIRERKRSRSATREPSSGSEISAPATPTGEASREETGSEIKAKMKKYNSISDLSPEYSGLPFVKKLKILNERQKLEELERELLVRSASLDDPGRPAGKRAAALVRSRSEATTMDKDSETTNPEGQESRSAFMVGNQNEKKHAIHLEASNASPESNETLERRNLKSILKKLSAEGGAGDDDEVPRTSGRGQGSAELKRLMRAPTVEGYAARHKKLTKSVTFDSDTPPSPADALPTPPPDKGKGFGQAKTTAILTLHLSNLSLMPLGGAKIPDTNEEQAELDGGKDEMVESSGEDGEEVVGAWGADNAIPPPCAIRQLIEEKIRTLPFISRLSDDCISEVKGGMSAVLQQVLEEVQEKFQSQLTSLRNEVKRKDDIILRLQSKIWELEVRNLEETQNFVGSEFLGRIADIAEMDLDLSEIVSQPDNFFQEVGDVSSASTEHLYAFQSHGGPATRAENPFPLGESNNSSDGEPPQFADEYSGDVFDHDGKAHLDGKLLQGRADEIQHFLRPGRGLSPEETPQGEELELAELPRSTGRKSHGIPRRNFSKEETHLEATSRAEKGRSGRREVASRSKKSFMNRVNEFQRSFSCSLEKNTDFVTLDIEDSSNSSDVENLHNNNDWEVQMLVEELAKKESGWEAIKGKEREEEEEGGEERRGWMSGATSDRMDDVKQLQQEVNTLKQMVCGSDLTRLTPSELDVLETIIEANDQKISQITKSNSLNEEDGTKGQLGRPLISGAASDGGINERRKKPSLRQKIGQAFSFDFHDIDNRKATSSFAAIRPTRLGKRGTVSCSLRPHRGVHGLWHSCGRPGNRALEGPERVSENFLERLSPSDVSPEEARPGGGRKRSREWAFEGPEAGAGKRPAGVPNSPVASGSGNGLNTFIKSVGQKVKQVVIGDAAAIRSQVPTISKLCEDRTMLKEAEVAVSEDPEVPPEELTEADAGNEPPEIITSAVLDRRRKIDPPDF